MPAKSSRRPAAPRRPRVLTGTVFITRQVHFNAAHRLHNPSKSQRWNQQQYGLCTSPHWHGHNYVLEVTLRGQPDAETGYIMDLSELKRLLERTILRPCDHHNLNEDVPFLRGIIPTTENLVIAFWRQIAPHVPAPAHLHRVRLYETPRNFADYHGPVGPA
ncbi:MAG TPA: 6-carboxytetrahydropterin synthase [Opitutaceae bacterium]|nr:6-carboxytetrahydropterin synthase [Opitutaceae bacterium]